MNCNKKRNEVNYFSIINFFLNKGGSSNKSGDLTSSAISKSLTSVGQQQHMSVQLGATPSPVSPPYSHHHLHHHQHSHLSHSVSSSVLSNQQHSLSGRGGGLSGSNNNKRSSDGRNSSDCNDNLTSSGFDSDRLDLRWNFANASARRFGGQC